MKGQTGLKDWGVDLCATVTQCSINMHLTLNLHLNK